MATVEIKRLVTGPMMNNCYLLLKNGHALVVDPGGDGEKILESLTGVSVDRVLLTHGHGDHIGGCHEFQRLGIPVAVGRADAEMLLCAEKNLSGVAGFSVHLDQPAEVFFDGGESFVWEGVEIKTFSLPGHTPGGIGYYLEDALFCGDQLFSGSVGRTDFPGGSFEQLEKSIRQHIYTLPDRVVLYPGHGPATTVGEEKYKNPFVRLN